MSRRPLRRTFRIRCRYLLRRLDRQTPEWMRWVAPWAWSLILHSLGVAALGLVFYANSEPAAVRELDSSFEPAGQLTDDLTSLTSADKAGDPFTTIQTPEPPSFSPDPKAADAIATPSSLLPIGPGDGLSLPDPALGLRSNDDSGSGGALRVAQPSVPFSGRQGEAKAKLVRREGGTVESEMAVERGLDWLARHQRKDGSWSLDCHGQCKGKPCPPSGAGLSDVAATGLALLPMLGAGHTQVQKGRYQASIVRGLKWLTSNQQETGEIYTGGDGNARMYSHAIATMTLCEAYGVSRDKALRGPAELAVAFIVKAQNPDDGGWRYNPGEAGDTSVFGWQMLALRSAQLSGLKIPPEVFTGASKYLDKAASDGKKTAYGYQPGAGKSPVMSAEALLVRQYLGWPRDTPALIDGVKGVSNHLLKDPERNIYYWYYATQLLHNMQNAAWKEWNPRVRNGLVKIQVVGDGCDNGSWDPNQPTPDRWGGSMGRHYTTAMSILTLEVYYRYLPLYKARDQMLPGTSAGSP
jgi:Squalene-hopene cyclase C-terminal domain/Prenyltransferase and squalene oxidase repeat